MAKRNSGGTARRKTAGGRGRSKTGRSKTAARSARAATPAKAKTSTRRAARSVKKRSVKKKTSQAASRKKVASRKAVRAAASRRTRTPRKPPRLDRVRRSLEDIVPTPPSSLNMDRRGSAARTGRAELAESLLEHGTSTTVVAGGDPDVNLETAYFSGEETPGGDNPTPDQDIVDDIGRALGVEYQDQEELKSGDKIAERDKHRWELDPASSEDYKDRT